VTKSMYRNAVDQCGNAITISLSSLKIFVSKNL